LVIAAGSAPLWPLALYALLALGVALVMVGLSWLLGQRHRQGAGGESYESGIVSRGTARLRFTARYYLIAIFFIIFDLEAVFIFAWALVLRQAGWQGYAAMSIFIVLLLLALLYLWRTGALDSGPERGGPPGRRGTGGSHG
jgi:NADH-quinone oxidoreductase subunit A